MGVRADEWELNAAVGPAASGPGSFESAFRLLWAPLVRLAWAMTGSRAAAEDIVQEAFVRAEPAWAGVVNPRAYLRAVVVNAVRRRQRRRVLELRHQATVGGDPHARG
ncbi:MAG: RNA polymerase sigma factor [Acidimicrobiales bacterium]